MLTWTEDVDDFDDTTFEATSRYHDEGSHFHYRIEMIAAENEVVWILDKTDHELLPAATRNRFFPTIEEAKAACEAAEVE